MSSQNFSIFPTKRTFRRVFAFTLASIGLHFLFFQSSWQEWQPRESQTKAPSSIKIRLHPETTEAAPPTPPTTVSSTTAITKKSGQPLKAAIPKRTPTAAPDVVRKDIEQIIPVEPIATEALATPQLTIQANATEIERADDQPEFKLRIPESVDMGMEVTYTKANGDVTHGIGSIVWERKSGKYKISIEVGINLLVTTLNLFTLTSEGGFDQYGLAPKMMTDARKTRAPTAIHFNHNDKSIVFSSSNKTLKMENGAQDAASLLFQLSAIGNAKVNEFTTGREFSIQVAEGRDANRFVFQVVGEEEIDSKLDKSGKILTVHITRPPKPGTYSSQLDIWLAPSKDWYPIQIRNTESNGSVTNQVVVDLVQKMNYER